MVEIVLPALGERWVIAALFHRGFLLLGCAFLLILSEANILAAEVGTTGAQPITTAQPSADFKVINPAKVIQGFTNGVGSIVVNLAIDPATHRRTDFSSRASLRVLQAEIKRIQKEVLDSIPANHLTVGFRYDNIPAFSAQVSLTGLQMLQAHSKVLSIEPVFTLQAHLAQGIPLIHGMTYRSTYFGTNLAIAICDTGIDYNHVRLGGGGFPNSKVIGGYDFGDNDSDPIPNTQAHGTCCAGIAAGDLGTVGDYIGGVAYGSRLYALKISSGSTGTATSTAMSAAWDWCVTHKNDDTNNPILVISTSFGGGRYFDTVSCDAATPSMTQAASNAVAAGITVLASSGNDGFCDSLAWPACLSSVISVGAVYDAAFGHYLPCIDPASCATKFSTTGCSSGYFANDLTAGDKVASYANVASFLTLMAPGNQCYTLDISGSAGYSSGDYFDSFGGTSAACPYAAGAVAALQAAAKALTGTNLSPQEVRNRLVTYGDNVTDTKVAITKPRVNLERAIQSLSGPLPAISFSGAALLGGNGNQTVDPNECNGLLVILQNNGNAAATNISAILSSATTGLSVTQSNVTYADLAAGASASNAVQFQISTTPAFACATPINLSLTVTYGGGSAVIPFSLPSGGANYDVSASSGASIVPGTTDTGNHADDGATTISLPFNYMLYGQSFSNLTVDSNGKLEFTGTSSDFQNVCLPSSGLANAIFAGWDDLRTDNGGGGIFTSISGSAPNRIFNIEWRAIYYGTSSTLNFEVRLYENQSRFDLIYGVLNGTGANVTVGVQKDPFRFTTFECNSGGLSNGLQLTFTLSCPDGGGSCVPPSVSFVAAPTSGVVPLTVFFTNSTTGATNYNWTLGNGATSSAASPSTTYSNAGSYSVTLTADGPGGTNSLTRTNYIVATNSPPPAVLFAGAPTNGLAPLTVLFTNLTSGATNYTWNFGDGNASTQNAPTNTYTNAGAYTVTLTAIGPGGTNSLALTNYIVATNPPPPPSVLFAGAPTNGVVPLIVVFTNLTTGATNYTWNFGDGNATALNAPTNTYTNAGAYTVTLNAIGPGGTNSLSLTNYIVATNPPPPPSVLFAGAPTNGVVPLIVVFTNLTTGATNYTWNFGDGNASTLNAPTNTYTNAGAYAVTLTAIGPGGTNNLSLTNYIVATNPPPPPSVLFAGEPTNGVRPLTVLFTNLTTGATNYTWTFGDGNSSVLVAPTNTYTNAGAYTVSLTAIGPGGTNSLSLTNFIVVTNPPPPSALFAGAPTNGLVPLTVIFTNLTTGATNYSWSFGDGSSSVLVAPTNTYTNAGAYTVTLTAFGPGGSNDLSLTNFIVVTNPPPPPSVLFAGEPTNGVRPLTVLFTNLTTGATNYTWTFGDGNSSVLVAPTNTYTNAGTYTVSLTAIGPGGTNSLSLTNSIVVTNPPPPSVLFTGEPTNGLAPLTVIFTNLTTGATNYSWLFGDGSASTLFGPTKTYTNAGAYTVTLTAIGPGGTNSLSFTNYIVATNLPLPSVLFAGEPTNGLAPLTVVFTNQTTDATNYNWNFGDGGSSSFTHPTNTYTNAGAYTVTLTAVGPGGSNSLSFTNYIVATNLPPRLAVAPDNLDFGILLVGASAQAAMIVTNTGGSDLAGSASLAPGDFNILTGTPFALTPAEATNLVIKFSANSEGAFSNKVVFTSNGGVSTNSIRGRAVIPPLISVTLTNGTNLALTFPTLLEFIYSVQYSDLLPPTNWTALQSITGDSTVQTIQVPTAPSIQRFYRLLLQ